MLGRADCGRMVEWYDLMAALLCQLSLVNSAFVESSFSTNDVPEPTMPINAVSLPDHFGGFDVPEHSFKPRPSSAPDFATRPISAPMHHVLFASGSGSGETGLVAPTSFGVGVSGRWIGTGAIAGHHDVM